MPYRMDRYKEELPEEEFSRSSRNQELYKEATKTISELKGYEKAYKQIYNASNVIANQRSYNSMRGLEQYGIGFDAVSNPGIELVAETGFEPATSGL